jgi:hypothetical protein
MLYMVYIASFERICICSTIMVYRLVYEIIGNRKPRNDSEMEIWVQNMVENDVYDDPKL